MSASAFKLSRADGAREVKILGGALALLMVAAYLSFPKKEESVSAEKVTIRSKSLREPTFGLGRGTGKRDYVLPGNEDYQVGDEIQKPQGGGLGESGHEALQG